MEEKEKKQEKDKPNDKKLSLVIQTGRGSADHKFRPEDKVEDVIAWAIDRFDLSSTEPWEVVRQATGGAPLEPQRTLGSYGLKDGEILIISAAGGGV
jgi:hypothetical protein